MITTALFALMLTAQCPPAVPMIVPPDISAVGYGFVMEIAGSTVDSAVAQHATEYVERPLPEGGTIRITFDRLIDYVGGPKCTPLRIVITATVCIGSGEAVSRSHATILVGANLNVIGGGSERLILEVQPLSDAVVATSDAVDGCNIEALIVGTGPQLAEKLKTAIPLEGLGVVAAARADGSGQGVRADAYALGFQWVLQVSGTNAEAPPCVPRVFLQGNTFTLVLSREVLAGLAAYHYRTGSIPKRMNADGLLDHQGDVAVQGLEVDIEPETLIVNWHGLGPGSRPVEAQWKMQFVQTIDGLALQIKQITVDGQPKPVPEEPINPFDELIKGIAAGPARVGLLASPMGRMRITTGAISREAIIIAGRV